MRICGIWIFCLLLAALPMQAAATACPANYHGGLAPDIVSEALSRRTKEICREGFAVMHSGVSATPLWSAQHLTSQRVVEAKAVARVDRFFAEPDIAPEDRAELEHYRGSGFDRGHLSPSADMDTVSSQAASFTLANIVPQNPDLNRRLWAHIEATARGLALSYGQVFVVTGVAFGRSDVRQIGGRVLVPEALWKAVYVPSASAAAAWWAPNSGTGETYEVVSIDELSRRAGIDAFPGLAAEVKARGALLPVPSPGNDRLPEGGSAGTRDVYASGASVDSADAGHGSFWGGLAAYVIREYMK